MLPQGDIFFVGISPDDSTYSTLNMHVDTRFVDRLHTCKVDKLELVRFTDNSHKNSFTSAFA